MPIKWKEMVRQFVSEWLCGHMSIPLHPPLCHFPWAHALCSILLSLTKLQRLPSNPLLLDTAGPVTMAADSHSFSFPLHCKPLLSLLWHEKRTVRVCEMGIFCEITWAFGVKILTFSMCIIKPWCSTHPHKLKQHCSVSMEPLFLYKMTLTTVIPMSATSIPWLGCGCHVQTMMLLPMSNIGLLMPVQ